jgi:hypothetical protein
MAEFWQNSEKMAEIWQTFIEGFSFFDEAREGLFTQKAA